MRHTYVRHDRMAREKGQQVTPLVVALEREGSCCAAAWPRAPCGCVGAEGPGRPQGLKLAEMDGSVVAVAVATLATGATVVVAAVVAAAAVRRHAQPRAYPRGGGVCEPIAALNCAFELLSLEAVSGIAPKSTGITGSHSTPLPRDGQVSNMILIDQPHMPVHAIPKGGNNTAGFLFLVGQLFICEWCRLLDVWVDCT